MKIIHFTKIPVKPVTDEKASRVQMRSLISEADSARNFIMRMFHVAPGGSTPFHSHDWEHEVFIVEGQGILVTTESEIPFQRGSVIFIEPNEEHQFKNTDDEPLSFLCLIPVRH